MTILGDTYPPEDLLGPDFDAATELAYEEHRARIKEFENQSRPCPDCGDTPDLCLCEREPLLLDGRHVA